ncbi:Hypothetical protein HVR_LOCUS131 [uncultured virus]|nr:Hypothetical protein HVR_LOCUS131 [uncultured virus]
MQSVLLASQSKIKLEVVAKVFPPEQYVITCVDCDICGLPAQPVNSAARCAKVRLNYAKKQTFPMNFDYYIAIENGLRHYEAVDGDKIFEECHVLIEHRDLLAESMGEIVLKVPHKYWSLLSKTNRTEIPDHKVSGYDTTIGDLMHIDDPSIDSKNWVKSYHGVCRTKQIKSSITSAMRELSGSLETAKIITGKYKSYTDYPTTRSELCSDPKPGIVFQDFFSIIREPEDVQRLIALLADQYIFDNIKYVVGPESRGFFGFGLSCAGGYGFIPLRKKGKLPGKIESITYDTEYSTDTLECPCDIPYGSRVVVFDDLIATGGSLRASCDLLEKLNCEIVDCVVLREVLSLREVAKQKLGRPYKVLLRD